MNQRGRESFRLCRIGLSWVAENIARLACGVDVGSMLVFLVIPETEVSARPQLRNLAQLLVEKCEVCFGVFEVRSSSSKAVPLGPSGNDLEPRLDRFAVQFRC